MRLPLPEPLHLPVSIGTVDGEAAMMLPLLPFPLHPIPKSIGIYATSDHPVRVLMRRNAIAVHKSHAAPGKTARFDRETFVLKMAA